MKCDLKARVGWLLIGNDVINFWKGMGMTIVRIQAHIEQEQNRKATVNRLVAQCIKDACANTLDLRLVLAGDMKSKVRQQILRKSA